MSTSTHTPSFRETVAAVAARAKAILPVAVNGRVESAVKLVLAHDVTFLDNGTVEVGSSSDPLKVHVLTGATCDCADFPRAPESWCKHRIAANLQKSVERVLARLPQVPVDPEMVEPWADNDGEEPEMPIEVPCEPTPAPAPLPEAAFSLTLKGLLDGQEALLTARGATADEFRRNLAAIRGLLDPPAPPAVPQGQAREPATRYCSQHGTAMQLNHKDGRSWWSHKTDQGWCQGKGGRS